MASVDLHGGGEGLKHVVRRECDRWENQREIRGAVDDSAAAHPRGSTRPDHRGELSGGGALSVPVVRGGAPCELFKENSTRFADPLHGTLIR